jgi:uncharacterized membrane protein HdeD (DUF308 family)
LTESLAAITFYVGLAALIFGAVRLARAALERRSRDVPGIVSVVAGGVCFVIAVALFVSGPRGVIPF